MGKSASFIRPRLRSMVLNSLSTRALPARRQSKTCHAVSAPTIITPHALPMFRDGEIARGSKRKREKDRMDPRKSRRPDLPVTGPGKGGRVGASATQHVVQNLVRDTTRDEDVSTAFLIVRSASLRDSRGAGAGVSSCLSTLFNVEMWSYFGAWTM